MTDNDAIIAALQELPAAPAVLVEGKTQQQVQSLYRYLAEKFQWTFAQRQLEPGKVLVWRIK